MKTVKILFILLLTTYSGIYAQYDASVVLQENGQPLHIADPCVYEDGGMYYLTGTTDKDNSFEYYTSSDLRTWKYGGVLLKAGKDHIGESCFWAPEIRKYNGKFYMTYSCYSSKYKTFVTCLAASDYPDKGFKDLYAPWFDPKYSAIDCDILVDDDGTPYLYYSHNFMLNDTLGVGEIYCVELTKDLAHFVGEPKFISSATQKWEKVNYARNRCNEGPWVIKHNGKYVMTYSANDTGYKYYGVGIQTANNPFGPWKKYKSNPMLQTDMKNGVSSPGHNSIVTTKEGKMYIVYHRHADPNCKKPNWDRIVCIDEIYFDKKGRLKLKK